MKRAKHRLPIPQHEFGFVPYAFKLCGEVALDGERTAREQAEAAQARREAEAGQPALFSQLSTHHHNHQATS